MNKTSKIFVVSLSVIFTILLSKLIKHSHEQKGLCKTSNHLLRGEVACVNNKEVVIVRHYHIDKDYLVRSFDGKYSLRVKEEFINKCK